MCDNKVDPSCTGRPDTPHNCSVQNTTSDALHVECMESFDGGLPQRFTLLVELESANVNNVNNGNNGNNDNKPSTSDDNALVYNLTNKAAAFSISGLEASSPYKLTVYASNAKGRSEPVVLKVTTLSQPERRTGEKPSFLCTNTTFSSI